MLLRLIYSTSSLSEFSLKCNSACQPKAIKASFTCMEYFRIYDALHAFRNALFLVYALPVLSTSSLSESSSNVIVRVNPDLSKVPSPTLSGSEYYGAPPTFRNCSFLIIAKTHKRIKRMLFNWTKQDKTCKFSRKSSFSSAYNIKTER